MNYRQDPAYQNFRDQYRGQYGHIPGAWDKLDEYYGTNRQLTNPYYSSPGVHKKWSGLMETWRDRLERLRWELENMGINL